MRIEVLEEVFGEYFEFIPSAIILSWPPSLELMKRKYVRFNVRLGGEDLGSQNVENTISEIWNLNNNKRYINAI